MTPTEKLQQEAELRADMSDTACYRNADKQEAHMRCAGMYTGEIERLKDVLHIDQTGLAAGLAKVNQIVEGYRWVTEGRGPYAWDDDKYKEEMGNMLDNISEAATKALNSSGAIAHSVCCGKEGRTATMEGIGYIKQDAHDKEIETLKAENEALKAELVDLKTKTYGQLDAKENKIEEAFTILIDQMDYEWYNRFITGSQIKVLRNIPSNYGVWVQSGDKKDKELGDNEEVDLKEPKMHSFFTGSKYSTEG